MCVWTLGREKRILWGSRNHQKLLDLCHAFNKRHSHGGLNLIRPVSFGQFENILNYGNLSGGCVEATERGPIVDHHTGANQFRTTIYGASNQRNLQQ